MITEGLKLGNYLLCEGMQSTVTEITITEITLDHPAYDLEVNCVFNEVEPITINNEWLLNLGFIPKGGYYNKDAFNIEVINEFEFIYFSIIDSEFNFEIKYVHQLQNIFYYLTGKELKL